MKRKYHNKYKPIDYKETAPDCPAIWKVVLIMVAMGIGALAYHYFLMMTNQL